MYINELMAERNMTFEKLCEKSGVPESTLRDILDGVSYIPNCKASTLYDIAIALNTSVEEILEEFWDEEDLDDEECSRFTLSNDPLDLFYHTQKMVLDMLNSASSDKAFMNSARNVGIIKKLASSGSTTMALYLTALINYLCRINKLPLWEELDIFNDYVLENAVYPATVMSFVDDPIELEKAKVNIMAHSIPEFLNFNIYETAEHIRGK